MKKLILSLLIVLTLNCFSGFAQSSAKTETYKLGETLTYEGKFSKAILRGIPFADLNFTVQSAPDGRNYLIKSEAKSKGTLAKLAGYKFYQNIQSTVDAERLQILKSVKRDDQGERVRDSEAIFDYTNNKVTYVETDPNDAARPPRRVASQIVNYTQDLVTAIYTVRYLPLVVGKTFEVIVSDSGLVYKIPVRVTARERQKSILGKIWCYRVEPEVFGANRIVDEKDGKMILWITDDARRLPIRTQFSASLGRVEVKLKEVKFVNENVAPKR
jgi:hypothetical protein